jgi:cytochrome c556
MKLQYILTILMVSVVLGGCQDTSDSRQELERAAFSNCMHNVRDSANLTGGATLNPNDWVKIIAACRVISADIYKDYGQEKDDE